ncbi:MAG TPA: hypothetical protein VIW03_17270 [Anaeromyxobacter sp.]
MRRATLALAVAAGCVTPPAPEPASAPAPAAARARHRVEDAPRELQPALARAEAAVRTLREQLLARLSAEIAAGGIAKAAGVYRREASELAVAISAQTGVALGRVSARARGGAAPSRPWVGPLVEETSARRASDVPAVVLDLGDRVGLLRPIAIAPLCLSCHGPAERVLPEVKLAADGPGPSDRAAFSEGDLRGFFWAEARK